MCIPWYLPYSGQSDHNLWKKTSKSPHAFKRQWCLCLDPNWKVSRICWHTILCKVIQSCSMGKKLCCKMWYNPSNWHWSIQYRDWYLDTSQKPKDPSSHNMLSTKNIAKSDCLTNFKHSNKAILRWCGLGLWWFVLRSALEGQQDMLWHHPCKVIQLCSLEKTLKKQCCKIWDGSWNWHCIWSLLHSKKVRCVSHDTSHILDNPIITSEKKLPNHHMLLRDSGACA